MQGECFDRLPRAMAGRVIHYRARFNLTPPPLPPLDDFDVIDES